MAAHVSIGKQQERVRDSKQRHLAVCRVGCRAEGRNGTKINGLLTTELELADIAVSMLSGLVEHALTVRCFYGKTDGRETEKIMCGNWTSWYVIESMTYSLKNPRNGLTLVISYSLQASISNSHRLAAFKSATAGAQTAVAIA